MQPKITIIIVNYNSSRIMGIVEKSISGACNLDYDNYELVVVDNGSTDGSRDKIKEMLDKCPVSHKLIVLSRNYGFAAGNNIGFQARDPDSKYVALLNNDAAPHPESLRALVEQAEAEPELASVQGMITEWDAKRIDNMGFIVDELLYSHAIYRGYDPNMIRKPHYCTFTSGAYSLYSIEAIKKVNKSNKIFSNIMFAYYDDKVLGMKFWANGYKVKAIPILAARHYGGGTFGKISPIRLYLITRSFIVLSRNLEKYRYKHVSLITYLIRQLAYAITASSSSGTPIKANITAYTKAVIKGFRLGREVKDEIDFSKVPSTNLSLYEVFKRSITPKNVNRYGKNV